MNTAQCIVTWIAVALWSPAIATAQSAPAPGAPPAAADAEPVDSFPVLEFRVLGARLLPALDVERAVYPHLGPEGGMRSVEAARDALVEAYRAAGFGTVFVDIPEQSVDDGVVRLQVREGTLESVRISGARYSSARELRRTLASAQRGATPNLTSLQAELATAARLNPDRRVTPLLRAGRTPGAVELELKVEDSLPLHGSLEVNDRYTADTSRLRASASLAYDQLFGGPQSLSMQYQWSPEERGEVSALAASFVRRLADSPGVWVAYAVDSDSDVAALGTLTVLGEGSIFGVRYIHPSVASADLLRSWTLGADYKSFEEDIRLPEGDPAVTPISYVMLSAGAQVGYRAERWWVDVSNTLSFGTRGLGNTVEEFAFKRFGGRPNFVVLRGGGTFEHTLPFAMSATLRAAWQYAPQPLVSNEQFAIGGFDSVRGYLEAEALVDRGVSGSFEVGAPAVRLGVGGDPLELRLFGFVDSGVGSIEQPLPSQLVRIDLTSVGAGLSMVRSRSFDAQLRWARTRVPAERTPEDEDRVHFSVRVGF